MFPINSKNVCLAAYEYNLTKLDLGLTLMTDINGYFTSIYISIFEISCEVSIYSCIFIYLSVLNIIYLKQNYKI